MRPWHPSMGPERSFRVVCNDGCVMVENVSLEEAQGWADGFNRDDDAHGACDSHIIESYVGWVPWAMEVTA